MHYADPIQQILATWTIFIVEGTSLFVCTYTACSVLGNGGLEMTDRAPELPAQLKYSHHCRFISCTKGRTLYVGGPSMLMLMHAYDMQL